MTFVLTVTAVDLAAIGIAASFTAITMHDLALFGLLLGCTAASVELTRKAGEPGGIIKDVQRYGNCRRPFCCLRLIHLFQSSG